MASRPFVVLLVLVSIVGVVVSLAAWCFLELVYQIQQEVFTHLPHALGYSSPPVWWPLPVLAIAGVLVALAIHQASGERRTHPGVRPGGGRPSRARRPARGDPGGNGVDRAGRGDRPRGASYRTGRRSWGDRDPTCPQRRDRPDRDPGGRRGQLRRAVVCVQLSARGRGDHDRSHCDRRAAAAPRPGAGTARRRDRFAGLARDGLVHRPRAARRTRSPPCRCRRSAIPTSATSRGRSRSGSRSPRAPR